MRKQPAIKLPNLDDYRQEFIQQGTILPLPTVPFSKTGLLAELPSPPPGKTGWPWTVETPPLTAMLPSGLLYPKMSIVTPSYNQGQFIEETIRAVLLQNYPNLEFIIIDGGSTDETVEILEKYHPWLSFWQSKRDRGQGHAINLGFSLASGDYLGWVNSDDLYLPSTINKVIDRFLKTDKEFVYGDAIEFNEITRNKNYWQGYWVLDKYLIIGGIIASHAAFWKNTIHIPIWEEINCAMDYELWMRMLPGKSRIHLKDPLALCRIQEQSKSYSESYKVQWKQDRDKIFSTYKIHRASLAWVVRELNIVHGLYKYLHRNNAHKISKLSYKLRSG